MYLYLYVCVHYTHTHVHVFSIYIYAYIHTCIHSSQDSEKPEKKIKVMLKDINIKGITLSYQSFYSELYQHKI